MARPDSFNDLVERLLVAEMDKTQKAMERFMPPKELTRRKFNQMKGGDWASEMGVLQQHHTQQELRDWMLDNFMRDGGGQDG